MVTELCFLAVKHAMVLVFNSAEFLAHGEEISVYMRTSSNHITELVPQLLFLQEHYDEM